MEETNTFLGGMEMDATSLMKKPNTYSDALNMDVILDELNSSFVITNSKGNKIQTTIPPTLKIYSWSVNKVVGASTINIFSKSAVFTSSTSSTNRDLYNFIISNFKSAPISVSYDSDNVVIVQDSNAGIIPPSGTAVSINKSREVEARQFHYPIASKSINNDIYIITTTSQSKDPKSISDPNNIDIGYGFVWKFNYDENSFDPTKSTLKLIYAANMNMSTYYNIPPTAILTRYETSAIQKIWWTDFYNPLRFINVADPNIMALDPTLISTTSKVDIYKPILTKLSEGGSLAFDAGRYQAAFRYTKTSGQASQYSELSNPVDLVSPPMNSSYVNYTGTPGSANKIITWNISDIDVDYDFIEFIVIQRKTNGNNDLYTIRLVETQQISNRDSLDFIIDGGLFNSGVTVLIEDVINYSATTWFTHCKTISQKDNMLVAANLKNDVDEQLKSFDFRAYRSFAPNSFDIKLTNSGVNGVYSLTPGNTSLSLENNPKTNDCINNYNDPLLASYYIPGLQTLGGLGPNVSYRFFTTSVLADTDPNHPGSGNGSAFAPFFSTNSTAIKIDLGVKSPSSNQIYDGGLGSTFYDGYKNTQLSGGVVGYQRGEIYRFAIQVFSKDKKPLFTEWIGDVKFPDHFDVRGPGNYCQYEDGNPSQLQNDFRLITIINGTAYLNVLGIEFTVNNLDKLDIGGYSIVRCDRTQADKTILIQGYVNSAKLMDYGTASDEGQQWYSDSNFTGGNRVFMHFPGVGRPDKNISKSGIFKYKFSSTTGGVIGMATKSGGDNVTISSKNYSLSDSQYKADIIIQDSIYVDSTSSGITQTQSTNPLWGTDYIVNRSPRRKVSGSLQFNDYGNPSYYLNINSPFNISSGTSDMYVANIETLNPNQYAGNTYDARSSNKYISCGHFRPIKTKANPIETFKVFGGDTYVGLYDSCLKFRDRGSVKYRNAQAVVVPLESDWNIELMYGNGRANLSFTDSFLDNNDLTEDNNYSSVYSASNNIKTYIPQPNPFIEVNEWNNRFTVSNVKVNGEQIDSWSQFDPLNIWDAEGVYGGINSMLAFGSKIYFWQDMSFGIIQINPRVYIGDLANPNVDEQMQLGQSPSKRLQRHDYISTISGTKHQGSTINSVSGMYWIDSNLKKIMKFSDGVMPLSDTKGLYAYMVKNFDNSVEDKPCYNNNGVYNGISAAFDTKRNKAIFTINNNNTPFTVTYNEVMDSFVSFYSYKPSIYIGDNKNLFTSNNNNIYAQDQGDYGNYYGTINPSSIKFITKNQPISNIIFDNLKLNTNSYNFQSNSNQKNDTWKRIRIANEYQNTDFQNLVVDSNIRRIERTWKLAIPRNRVLYTSSDSPDIYTDLATSDKQFGERIRGSYIKTDLEYDNQNNNLLRTNYITVIGRESSR